MHSSKEGYLASGGKTLVGERLEMVVNELAGGNREIHPSVSPWACKCSKVIIALYNQERLIPLEDSQAELALFEVWYGRM